MLLLLIRHGLTGHIGVRLTGWTPGVGLSEPGRAQAEGLVGRLEGVRIDALYSSPLERAVETAAPLARARRMKVERDEALGEVHYGSFQGRTYAALMKTKTWKHLRAWPSDARFPGGETLRETQARAVAAVEGLRAAHPRHTVAVFSHADWIRLAIAHYLGVHIDLFQRIAIDPVSVSALHFGERGVQVRRVNDVGTLGDLTIARAPRAKPRGARR